MDAKSIEQCPPSPHYTLQGLKPFINYKDRLDRKSSRQFKKCFPKYVHQVYELSCQRSSFRKQIERLKLVHKVNTEGSICSSLKVSHIIKTLKPLRKHIKHMMTSKDWILSHFPYLSQYELGNTPLSWKIFLSFRAVKVLKIQLAFRYEGDFEVSRLKRFRSRFGKVINNSRSLEHLQLYLREICSRCTLKNFAAWMFSPIIPSLRRLKSFIVKNSLRLNEGPRYNNRSLKQILNQVTHFPELSICYSEGRSAWNPLDFNSNDGINTLNNLAQLSLESERMFNIRPNHLHNLTYLKKLYNLQVLNLDLGKFGFTAFSNYFTLPKQIQIITLRLNGFEWDHRDFQHIENITTYLEKNPKYQTFFDQWRGLDRLKDLTLTVKSRQDYVNEFIACILKRLHSLETLNYKHESSKKCSYGSQHKFVSFNDIWKAVEQSRLTLQKVSITAQYLSLDQIENMSFDMPKLKRLGIQSKGLSSTQDLIELLIKFSSLDTVLALNIPHIIIQSDKDFSFFDWLQNMKLKLKVVIKAGKPETFTKSLCRVLEQNNLQGSLCVIVPEKIVYSLENLGKLEQVAVRNTSLSQFKMMLSEALTYFEVKNGSFVYERNQYPPLHLYYNN